METLNQIFEYSGLLQAENQKKMKREKLLYNLEKVIGN